MKSMKIFICLTPFNTLYSQELLKSFKKSEKEKMILVTRSIHGFNSQDWDEVYFLKKFKKKSPWDITYYKSLVKDAKDLYIYIKSLVNNGSSLDVYFSNLDSFYTNHLFFRYKNYKIIRFYSIQDGTLNIFSRKISNYMFKRQLMKSLMAIFFGFFFRPFFGTINGIDRKEIIAQYLSFYPEKFKEKTVVIGLKQNNSNLNSLDIKETNILLLGGEPLIEEIGKDNYYKILTSIFLRIQKEFPRLKHIYYKPHPFTSSILRNKVIQFMGGIIPEMMIREIDGTISAESIDLVDKKVKALYSINSSASVNYSFLYKDYLIENTIAGLDIIYENLFEREKFKEFYKSLGIIVINSEGEKY